MQRPVSVAVTGWLAGAALQLSDGLLGGVKVSGKSLFQSCVLFTRLVRHRTPDPVDSGVRAVIDALLHHDMHCLQHSVGYIIPVQGEYIHTTSRHTPLHKRVPKLKRVIAQRTRSPTTHNSAPKHANVDARDAVVKALVTHRPAVRAGTAGTCTAAPEREAPDERAKKESKPRT